MASAIESEREMSCGRRGRRGMFSYTVSFGELIAGIWRRAGTRGWNTWGPTLHVKGTWLLWGLSLSLSKCIAVQEGQLGTPFTSQVTGMQEYMASVRMS